ncbi:response regulator [Rivibacter subsaxonicus]|uniref:Regulatory Fis family protein n=1 Tax=Rivibacter subsaxonicus TaxID=457575 RepID=A0A4V2FU49_9BURK|nr:response regulator [Rivibacter subsaxonicus]RZU00596.1 regulatory Fis family protein [Rivibacter subsaxonicus]
MATILVVDDELGIRGLLSEILSDEGHTIELAENAAQARAFRERERPDLVLLDIWMPDVDGVSLLKEWSAGGQLTMPVIMMSGHGTIDTAVEAVKVGAMAFLEKPITLAKLLRAVEQGLAKPARPAATVTPLRPLELRDHGVYVGESMAKVGAVPVNGVAVALGPQAEQSFELDRPLREARDAFEKAYFEFHLARENGSMTRVAEKTGLERTHLYRKLKQLGVDLSRGRKTAVV